MTEILQNKIQTAKSLDEIKRGVLNALIEVGQANSSKKIGYVSGILTSDGPEFFRRNMDLLLARTSQLRQRSGFPTFSAGDIFTSEILERVDGFNLPSYQFLEFWREILSSDWITDIFMTPRWEESKGATDEHETAKKLNLRIHY